MKFSFAASMLWLACWAESTAGQQLQDNEKTGLRGGNVEQQELVLNKNVEEDRPTERRDSAGDVVYKILMMGNSYTGQSNVAGQLQHLLRGTPGISASSSVKGLTKGGWKIYNHRDETMKSGSTWHTETRPTKDYDYVILQDQSQTPTFIGSEGTTNSKNAAVQLDGIFEDMGAEIIFYMTWGRRYGDNQHPYWDVNTYKTMQAKLKLGYEEYIKAVKDTNNRQAYMGPVGLAFEYLHDTDYAFFTSLYKGDNSHVQPTGAYIAACVFYSTITGELCSGKTTTYGFDSTTLSKLQAAADYASTTNRVSSYPLPTPKQSSVVTTTTPSVSALKRPSVG